uniref:MobA/MobL protein domain-containing protein n=1 Tax=Carnobacterium maltaromaticum TaxID=2751 RepID=A0A1Z5AXD9_CARML|nr:MobQ family relaxase [Carnobacterium maltaromaticum]CRI06732.1 conserved protein of unknown function [Carnobacterium maltaromaticum]
MAIFHLSMKVISRANGQNAVASAAYRSGELLVDEKTGEEKFYSRTVAPETHILAPNHSPEWVFNRQKLWNEVENAELRINSQVAREVQIALPLELSNEQQTELTKNFIQDVFVSRGMVADIGIHRDHAENPHAHVMLTTREITPDGFTTKNRDWNSKEYLKNVREQWANYVNKELELTGSKERIDHRSHADRELSILPTKHVGVKAKALSEKGYSIDSVTENLAIKEYNKKIISLEEKREELLRQKYAQNQATENPNKDAIKKAFDHKEMVVPVSVYLYNQSKMAIILNSNTRQNKILKNKKSTAEQISKAKESIKQNNEKLKEYRQIKEDYLEHTKKFLMKTDKSVLAFADQLRIKFKHRDGEILIRYANKMQDMKQLNFMEITKSVESDLVFNSVKKLLNGRTDYYSVSAEVSNLQKYEKENQLNLNDKKELSNKLAYLTFAKESYETRAVSELMSKGHSELVTKYWTDKSDRSPLVKLFDTLVKYGDMTSSRLEQITQNAVKLDSAKKVLRGNLDYFTIEFKIKNLEKWESSIKVKLESAIKTGNTQEVTKQEENLKIAKENSQLMKESKNIMKARVTDFINSNDELKALVKEEIRNVSLDKIAEINSGLYDKFDKLNSKEMVSEMQRNMIRFNEEKIMEFAYKEAGKAVTQSYYEVNTRITKVKEQIEGIRYDEARKEKLQLGTVKGIVEDMYNERKALQEKRFTGGEGKKRIAELDQWFEINGLTAKSLSGTLGQLEYKENSANYKINKYERLTEVTLPVLEEVKKVHESRAIRYVEKELNVDKLFQYEAKISQADKSTFVNLYEFRKENGNLKDNLDLSSFEKSALKLTEKYQIVESDLKTLAELKQKNEQRFGSLANVIDGQKKQFENQLGSSDLGQIKEIKEKINELTGLQKEQNKIQKEKIAEIRLQEQKAYEEKSKLNKGIKATKNITKALDSVFTTVTDAQKDAERRKRMQSLKKEKGEEFGLELERKL